MRSPKHFLKHERGVAMLEFALVLPFLIVLVFGSVEIIRVLYMQQRLEKAGYVVADITSRYLPAENPLKANQITVTQMNDVVFPIFGRIMGEFQGGPIQAVIVTSIVKESGVKRIKWQMAFNNNTLTGCDGETPQNCVNSIVNGLAPGAIGPAVANTATAFPPTEDGILATMPNNENLIVSEVFIKYTPILRSVLQGMNTITGGNFFLQERIFIKRTYATSRNGNLVYLPPTFPVP